MFKNLRQGKSEAERAGDWDAFETEAMSHLDSLFRIAMWRVRDRKEAEDLVQETFTEALRSFHLYQQGTNCRAWLVTIMYDLESKRRRKNDRLRLVSDDEERIAETIAFEAPTPQGITEEEVLDALAGIPSGFSQVVLLADVEELTYKEIAEALHLPVGTVMSRLNRGRKLLRISLAAYANKRGTGGGEISAHIAGS